VKPEEIQSTEEIISMFSIADVIVTHDYNIQEFQDKLKRLSLFDFLNIVTIEKTDFDSLYDLMIKTSPELLNDFIEEELLKENEPLEEKKAAESDSIKENKESTAANAPCEIAESEQLKAPYYRDIDFTTEIEEFLGKLHFLK
jgi:hypothetical protein